MSLIIKLRGAPSGVIIPPRAREAVIETDTAKLKYSPDGTVVKTVATEDFVTAAITTSLSQSLAERLWKTPCKTVSTTNISLAGDQTISGVSVTAGDRVLVVGQTNKNENGIYIVGPTWSRSSDFDNPSEINGAGVSVSTGDYADTLWYQTGDLTGTVIGSQLIDFIQYQPITEIDGGTY